MNKSKTLCLIAVITCSISVFGQRLSETVVPEHYELTLRPNLDTNRFTGEEVIDVRLEKPSNAITLNAVDITFDSVRITAQGKTQTATTSPEPANEMVTLTVPGQIPAGKVQIMIRYTGELNNGLRGFYRSTAGGHKYAVTQFEPTDARRAFPSFDEPAFKATFDITVIAPEGDMVISNGNVVSDIKGPEPGSHTVKFATTPKMSTYLVAFLVGQFECLSGSADGIPVRVCAPPEKQQYGEYALGWAENILKFYNRYYTVKYPYGKLDLIAIPDFEAGAMENTAAITFRDVDLLIDPKTATTEQEKNVALVIAHEMAHQWFGDLVTMKWWNDIWLNEGFATWMESKPVAELKPEWGIAQDDQASAIEAMRVDSLKSTRPIRTNAETSAEINELFDAIAYNKTAAVLRMVETYVSPEKFRNGINQYLQAHAYGNATAEDFWTKLTQVTGMPVDRIMQSYVDQPGVPIIAMSGDCTKGTTSITQRRFFLEPEQSNGGTAQIWAIPACLKNSSLGQRTCELISKPVQKVAVDTCREAVNENAGAGGYYRTGYTPEQVRALTKIVEKALTPTERLSILANEWALVRADQHQIPDYLDVVDRLAADRTHGVWDQIARSLEFVDDNMIGPPDRNTYERWVRGFATPVMEQVGWSARPGDDYEIQKVRADAFRILGYIGHEPRAVEEARKIVQRYLKDPASVDSMLSGPAFTIAASQGDSALFDEMLVAMSKTKMPDVYYQYLYALTEFRDPALIERTLKLAVSDRVRSQDMPIVLLRLMANPASRDLTWTYVKTNWPEITQKASIWGSALVVRGTSSFCSVKGRGEVQQFFAEHEVPQAQRTLAQSLESIDDCVRFKAAQEQSLAAWLSASKSPANGQ